MIRVDDRDGVKWFVVTDENGQEVEWVPGRFGVLIAHEVEQLQQRLAAAQTRNECPICGLTPGAISTCFCEECVGELRQRLAAAEAERDETSQYVSDLVMLVSRLVQQVRNHDETNDVAKKAMDYLRRKDLILSIIRGIASVDASSSGGDDE